MWPDPALRRHLHQLAVHYHAECGGRMMHRENIHLTLLFLGGVEPAKLEQLQQAVGVLLVSPFAFELQHFACWKHNRIGYVAPDEEVPALQQLAHALVQVTGSAGIKCDDRAFTPHVTLLRDVGRQVDTQPIRAVQWPVRAFSLVESVATERGVRYRVLQTWPCRPAE